MQLPKNIAYEENFSFAKHTTYGLGGNAKIAFFPKTINEATEIFDFVNSNYAKYFILGNGSNVLASDEDYDGAVIHTGFLSDISHEGTTLTCLSGTSVKKLLDYCILNGLEGLEYLAGIPASIGGLTLMNGGINCTRIESNVTEVLIYDGKSHNLKLEDCKFGNKHSTMCDINAIILSVSLKVTKSTKEKVKNSVNYFLNLRKAQPKGKSCGCVFKNPENISAGRIIDETGLKGLQFGGATVSKAHANFIINESGTAKDVYKLICEVKKRVYERYKEKLEEEVVYIGKFNETDV